MNLTRVLFKEYQAALDINMCFQHFDEELANLPGYYAPPSGRLLLAFVDDELVGCVALRKLSDSVCEMKRLFLRPSARGQQIGRKLVDRIIGEARAIGYRQMRLDTLPGKMDAAIAIYRSVGFYEIGPYYDTPIAGTIFMELPL